jgi:hypothetical protein
MHDLITSRIMPRTTIDLDPSVLRALRRKSQDQRKSMGQVASELLARSLRESETPSPAAEGFKWVTRHLGKPRVDLEDKEAVRAILDTPR